MAGVPFQKYSKFADEKQINGHCFQHIRSLYFDGDILSSLQLPFVHLKEFCMVQTIRLFSQNLQKAYFLLLNKTVI